MSAAVGIAAASASPDPGDAQATLPLTRLVPLARNTARGLGDARVRTALVVATTKHAAEDWLQPGASPPGEANPRAFVIVLTGHFVCTTCSFPAGAKPPRGRSAQIVWVPGHGISDFGLTRRLPTGLDNLGRVVRIALLRRHCRRQRRIYGFLVPGFS